MGDLTTLNNEVLAAEGALKPYQDPNALASMKGYVNEAWKPLLESSINVTQDQLGSFLPTYMGIPEALGGTSAADLSPTQKLQSMGNKLGGMSSRLYGSTALSDYLGGKVNEMYNNALQAWQLGNQTAAQAYDRAFQKYQLAWQAEENKKARQASGGGGGGGMSMQDVINAINGTGESGNGGVDTDSMNADQLYAWINQYGSTLDQNTLNGLWSEWRGKAYGSQYANTDQSVIDTNKTPFANQTISQAPTGSTVVGKGMYKGTVPTYSA